MTLFRFTEDRLPFLELVDKWDLTPVPREGLMGRALPVHRVLAAGSLTPGVAFAAALDPDGQPTRVTALSFGYLHLPAERAQAVLTRVRQLGPAYLAFSTFAHAAKGDDDSCFCVVFPVTRAMTCEEHPRAWRAFDGDLGGHADLRGSQPFTVVPRPSSPRARLHRAFYESRDGFRVDVGALLSGSRTVPDDDGAGPCSNASPYVAVPALAVEGAR
jgi:hypothetical protein